MFIMGPADLALHCMTSSSPNLELGEDDVIVCDVPGKFLGPPFQISDVKARETFAYDV
jgi:hypothetical protein